MLKAVMVIVSLWPNGQEHQTMQEVRSIEECQAEAQDVANILVQHYGAVRATVACEVQRWV